MCTFVTNDLLQDHQLSSWAQSSNDLLSEFDLEQTSDLMAVSSEIIWQFCNEAYTDSCSVICDVLCADEFV